MQSDFCEELENLSNLILSVMDDKNDNPLWRRFFRIQIAFFILEQKNLHFELEQARAAYSLIHDSWNEFESYLDNSVIPIRNYDNIIQQINIDFSSLCLINPINVSK